MAHLPARFLQTFTLMSGAVIWLFGPLYPMQNPWDQSWSEWLLPSER